MSASAHRLAPSQFFAFNLMVQNSLRIPLLFVCVSGSSTRKIGWYVVAFILLILTLDASSRKVGRLPGLPFLYGPASPEVIHSQSCNQGKVRCSEPVGPSF